MQVNKEEFDELKTRVDQHDEGLTSLHVLASTAIDVMKQGITVMENGFKDVGKQIADMRGDIGDMRGDVSSMQREMTTMRGDIGDMRADIRDLKDAITKNGGAKLRQQWRLVGVGPRLLINAPWHTEQRLF